MIAAGALVPEGMKVPDESMVAGVPAKIKGKLKEEHAVWVREYEGDDSYYLDYIRKWKESKIESKIIE